jgi:prepilin-type N-terminal cleavage/methylation domain-containing protein
VFRLDGGVLMRPWLRRRLGGDDGFTLVELVMTVAIVGIIVVPLTGVLFSYLRNTVDTAARLTESHDVQFTAAYWQRDVASIGVRSTTYNSSPSVHSFPLQPSVDLPACNPLPAGATAVVTLGWSDYATGSPQLVTVTYATRPQGSGYQLFRVRCGSQNSTTQLADNLDAPPTRICENAARATIACTGSGDQVPAVVKLRLQVHDSSTHNIGAYTATLTGERRQS